MIQVGGSGQVARGMESHSAGFRALP